MPLTNVHKKLENINALPGKNDKRSLLKNYLTNDKLFQRVIKLMISELDRFKMTDLPAGANKEATHTADEILSYLVKIAKKNGVSNEEKQQLADMVGTGVTRDVVIRILKKDPRAGFGLNSVSAVAPWLTFKTPYQRCSGISKIDRVSYPAIVQEKADGMFNYGMFSLVPDTFSQPFLTRRGKSMDVCMQMTKEMQMISNRIQPVMTNPVLHGELVVASEDGSKVLDRKTGNGLINSLLQGKEKGLAIAHRVMFHVWDVVPGEDFLKGECKTPYGVRWNILMNVLNDGYKMTAEETALMMRHKIETGIGRRIFLIDSKEVQNEQEAMDFYKEKRRENKEGAVLKDMETIWKSNTSPTLIKLKNFVQGEFRIIGVTEGKGKLEGMMGSLVVASEDEKVISSVGSGFLESDRDLEDWQNSIGEIITVQFESLITKKKEEKISLFLPTFIEKRTAEKTEADTLEQLEEMFKKPKGAK